MKILRRLTVCHSLNLVPKSLVFFPKSQLSLSKEGIVPVKMSFNSYEATHPTEVILESGPPVIIMHGLFGSKSNWNALSKTIHNNCKKKIVTVDARNHGDSPHTSDFSYRHLAADIQYLMTEMDVKKAHLIGHSMGGRAVMAFALTYPHLVESLIVVDISPINCSANMNKMSTYFDALKSVKLHKNLTMSQARKAADDQLAYWISDESVRQFLLTNLTQIDGGRFKWRINLGSLSKQFDSQLMKFPKFATVCKSPTMFVGGLKSDYLRFEDHGAIKNFFPKAEFHYLDCGHWVHAEKPNEFVSLVCSFLAKKNEDENSLTEPKPLPPSEANTGSQI